MTFCRIRNVVRKTPFRLRGNDRSRSRLSVRTSSVRKRRSVPKWNLGTRELGRDGHANKFAKTCKSHWYPPLPMHGLFPPRALQVSGMLTFPGCPQAPKSSVERQDLVWHAQYGGHANARSWRTTDLRGDKKRKAALRASRAAYSSMEAGCTTAGSSCEGTRQLPSPLDPSCSRSAPDSAAPQLNAP